MNEENAQELVAFLRSIDTNLTFEELVEPEQESQFTPEELAETTVESPSNTDSNADAISEEHLDEDGYMLPTHPDYCSACHILNLIDDVMINTLSTRDTIGLPTADVLVTLSIIRKAYLSDGTE